MIEGQEVRAAHVIRCLLSYALFPYVTGNFSLQINKFSRQNISEFAGDLCQVTDEPEKF